MEYFTEQAPSHREVIEKIRNKYGDQATITTYKSIKMGGFLGLFAKDGIEMSGYLSRDHFRSKQKDLEEEKKKILSLTKTKDDQALDKVLQEIREMKESLKEKNEEKEDLHPAIEKVEKLLELNEFSKDYIQSISGRVKREFSLEELENEEEIHEKVVEWIGGSLQFYRGTPKAGMKIVILVGPTGVGKTTTIAKLAAMYGVQGTDKRPLSVRMLTIDNYRIGARMQIETYGEIMNIPVSSIETKDDLDKQLAIYRDVDLVLIDTIGKSPKDYKKLSEMRELLDGCGNSAEIHLAMSASTRYSDMENIMREFEPFKYKAVVITKLDETSHIGSILSILSQKNKPVSYITNGQMVPQDIKEAGREDFIKRLEGFRRRKEREVYSTAQEGNRAF